jgi:hypothetical protein
MAVARYRDRHSVAEKKSDQGNSFVLANVLRTDMHGHRAMVQPRSPGRTGSNTFPQSAEVELCLFRRSDRVRRNGQKCLARI